MRSFGMSVCGLVLAAAVAVGCASSPPAGETSSAGKVCVKVREINSFHALDDRNVLVKASAGDYYLLTIDKGCVGLSFARGIAIAGGPTRVCSDGFDFLAYDHPGSGLQRCRIVDVEAVKDEKAARALIESRPAS
jgi:hypothetical protein